MKRRIKILYLLTIAAIIAFGWLEGRWLLVKYDGSLIVTQLDMFEQVNEAFRKDYKQREGMLDERWQTVFWHKIVLSNDSIVYNGAVLVVEKGLYEDPEYTEILELAKEGRLPGMVDYHECLAEGGKTLSQNRVTEAMKELVTMKAFPLNTDSMACMINSLLDVSSTVKVETVDSLMWEPRIFYSQSMLNPELKVVYPLSPFGYQVAVTTMPVPVSVAVKDMAMTLMLSFIVAVLLVSCLIYQMATIRRQQKIADLQRSFTLTMLHELKRPLGALKIFISFMRNERLSESDRHEALENASCEIDNLSSYFNKLRAITYNEASEVPLSFSSFNLKEAVEESVALAGDANVSLQGDADTVITAERQSLVNVLCNLIENAVKYAASDEGIDVSWKALDAGMEISVADRGPGIPDADKQRIFDQFYRVVNGTDIPGMGLGLAYVRQVVNAHGGSISVKDRDGGGTVFTINLPQ